MIQKSFASIFVFALALVAFNNTSVFAEENTNTTNVSLPKDLTVTPAHDIDDEITSAKLRAATGAKSKWSFSSSYYYAGASITNPFSTERPKIYAGSNAADPVTLSGNLGIKYRLDDHDHLVYGFGLKYIPGYVVDKKIGRTLPEQLTANDPRITYVKLFRANDVQNVLTASIAAYTAQEDVDNHMLANIYLSHTMLANIGTSKLSVGLNSLVTQDYFSELAPGQDTQTYFLMFGISPMLEYSISDKVSINTSTSWLNWAILNSDRSKAILYPQSQSLGVGIAVQRDFYLYPNIQWGWSKMTPDQTTVGLSANINL